MGYCKPIEPGAQQRLDERTGQRLRDMHARGEKVHTLGSRTADEARSDWLEQRHRLTGKLTLRFK